MGGVLVARIQQQLADLSRALTAGASSDLIRKLANPESLLDPSLRASLPGPLVAALIEILSRSVWSAFLAGFFAMLWVLR